MNANASWAADSLVTGNRMASMIHRRAEKQMK